MTHKVISFYKYVQINDPEKLRETIKKHCENKRILGRILLGKEGINGAVSGTVKAIELFKKELLSIPSFSDLTFREQESKENTYHKLVIRVRDEICAFGKEVNLKNKGQYIKPQELEQMYQNKEDFVIVDARNDYEFDVGRFKNSIKLPIKNFREFGDVAPKELKKNKDKKIVLYCTGGIRCEKASAYMKEQGFENVHHLQGGIINYVNKFEKNWEGGLFVFDDRLVSEHGEAITRCRHCSEKTEKMINCHNIDCDKLIMVCQDCQVSFGKNCNLNCKASSKQRIESDIKKTIGIVENYYAKIGVALVKLKSNLSENTTIIIEGKTTKMNQKICGLRDENGKQITQASNQLVTFPVSQKVRKNDMIMMIMV